MSEEANKQIAIEDRIRAAIFASIQLNMRQQVGLHTTRPANPRILADRVSNDVIFELRQLNAELAENNNEPGTDTTETTSPVSSTKPDFTKARK